MDIPIGAAFRAWGIFVDTSGTPLTTLTPAPVFTLLSPSGAMLVNAATMTQLGSTEWWYYNVPAGTTTVSGGHPSKATCADTDVANNPIIKLVAVTEYNLDTIQAHTDLITSGTVFISSPLATDTLLLTIVRGDDYTDAAGRAITWTSPDWIAFGLLTAVSITFKARAKGVSLFTKAMTAVDSSTVKLQLTDAETVAFITGTRVYTYNIELVMSNNEIVTLVINNMSVVADVR